jgi:hypothetical protein
MHDARCNLDRSKMERSRQCQRVHSRISRVIVAYSHSGTPVNLNVGTMDRQDDSIVTSVGIPYTMQAGLASVQAQSLKIPIPCAGGRIGSVA